MRADGVGILLNPHPRMLTVIEDAGPRLPEVAVFLAAAAVLMIAMKDFVLRLRAGHPRGAAPPDASRASRVQRR